MDRAAPGGCAVLRPAAGLRAGDVSLLSVAKPVLGDTSEVVVPERWRNRAWPVREGGVNGTLSGADCLER